MGFNITHFSSDYSTFDEVFHSEPKQGFDWARKTVDLTKVDLITKEDLILKKNDLISKLKRNGKKLRIIETKGIVSNTYECDFCYIKSEIWFIKNENLDHSFIDQLNDQNYANIETDDLTITAICI
jgi:hypothetical protein